MTTPPPPPGGGDNQPDNPSGSNPYPSSGSGSTPSDPPSGAPSYGSAPGGGMPPQAPPPAPGNYPAQGGNDKAKIMAIISIVTGVIGFCCCLLSIVAIVLGILARKEYEKRGESATLANVGLGLGIASIVLSVLLLILQAAGVIDWYSFSASTSTS